MKKYLLTILTTSTALLISGTLSAHDHFSLKENDFSTTEEDTTQVRFLNQKDDILTIFSVSNTSEKEKAKKPDEEKEVKYPRTFGGITFARMDWGFSRIMDEGSFTLSDDNKFLSYKKASNFGFDVAQFGIRTSEHFKIYISAGFEWNYLRLKENIILHENETPLNYTVVDRNDVNYRKNVFTSTYLRTPLTFEWRSDKMKNNNRMKIAFGPMTGILLKGTQRLRSDEFGKQKFKDNYNLQSFQYGGFIRVGVGEVGVFAKYYANDVFEKSPTQEGLNNLTFGLTLGF